MKSHSFRPLDAVLGIAVAFIGVLVAIFGFENLDDDQAVAWFAIGAAVIGLGMLPWPRRKATMAAEPPPPLPDESSPDG